MSITRRCLRIVKSILDSVGDHPLNMAATNLGVNAFALTQQAKLKIGLSST